LTPDQIVDLHDRIGLKASALALASDINAALAMTNVRCLR
jgi:hypothetical protein